MKSELLRNFAIIAHVDHGKSTLADRFLELTGTIDPKTHDAQVLDRNPISRERGITIKLAPVRMQYRKQPGEEYILNLIDTPGHVDFSYEVDRTLACVEGALLLVDATQGIQAQTIANAYKSIEKGLSIIPVVNKIDLPQADVQGATNQLCGFLGVRPDEIYTVSAKTGLHVPRLLEAIVRTVPPPIKGNRTDTKALIFDSYYDPHRGVIAFIRVVSGSLQKGQKVRLCAFPVSFVVNEVGIFTPDLTPVSVLSAGEIGYIVTNLKDIHEVQVGDTIVGEENADTTPLAGYQQVKPMVFASLFTTDTADYLRLKNALEKLYLNDSSLEFTAIYSRALGAGFRVGFLGLLHADVVRERLEREFNLDLILTPPQVEYRSTASGYEEPIVSIMIVTPNDYMGAVMALCTEYRAQFITMDNKNQITLQYEMPLSEMISDFFDRLKSVTSGYASLDWEFLRYEPVIADKLHILLNGDPVEEFSEVVVADRAYQKGTVITKKMRTVIPRQMYEVKIQAQYKGKIIASERIAPFRKDVTAKLYGGDRTRKDKLLKKQKEGKKKLKMIGRVEIPKEAFMKLFHKNSS